MPEENIVQTIRLEGGDEVERRFRTIGDAGRAAFDNLRGASQNLDFSKVENDVGRAGRAISQLVNNVSDLAKTAGATRLNTLNENVKELGEQAEDASANVRALNENTKKIDARPVEESATAFTRLRNVVVSVLDTARQLPGTIGDIASSARGIVSISAGIGVVGAAVVGAFALAKSAASSIDELRIAANRLGLESPEELQKLRFALVQLGIEADKVDEVIKTFGDRSSEAAKKGEAEFKKLGITFAKGAESAEIIGRQMVNLATQGLGATRGFTELDGILAQFGGKLDTEKLQRLADLLSRISDSDKRESIVKGVFGDVRDIEQFTQKLTEAGAKTNDVIKSFSTLRSGVTFRDLATETAEFVDSLKSISDEAASARVLRLAFGPELADRIKDGTASVEELQLKFIDLRQSFDRASSVSFGEVVREINRIEDPAERARAAVALLGDELGRKLIAELERAGGGITRLSRRFDDLHLSLPEEEIERSKRLLSEFRAALAEYSTVQGVSRIRLGQIFEPLLGPAASGLRLLSELLTRNRDDLRKWVSELSGAVSSAIGDFVNLLTRAQTELRKTGEGEFVLEPKVNNEWVRTFVQGARIVLDGLKAIADAATVVANAIGSALGVRINPIFIGIALALAQLVGGFKALAIVAAGVFVAGAPGAERFRKLLASLGENVALLTKIISFFLEQTWADLVAALSGEKVQQQWVQDLIDGIKDIGPVVAAVVGGLLLFRRELAAISVVGIFNRLTGAFNAIAALAITLSIAVRGVAASFALLARFAGAPVAIATALVILVTNFELLQKILDPVAKLLNGLFGTEFFNGVRLANIAVASLISALAVSLLGALGVVGVAARRAFGVIGFVAGLALTQLDSFKEKTKDAGSSLDLLGKDLGDRVRQIVSGLDQTASATDRAAQGIARTSSGIIDVQKSLQDTARRQALGIIDVSNSLKKSGTDAQQTGKAIQTSFESASSEIDEFVDNLDQQSLTWARIESDINTVADTIQQMVAEGVSNLPKLDKVAKDLFKSFDDRGVRGVIDVLKRDLSSFTFKFDLSRFIQTLKDDAALFRRLLAQAFDPSFVLERFRSLGGEIAKVITAIDVKAEFNAWLERVWENDIVIRKVGELGAQLVDAVSQAFDSLRQKLQSIFNEIVKEAETAFGKIRSVVDTLRNLPVIGRLFNKSELEEGNKLLDDAVRGLKAVDEATDNIEIDANFGAASTEVDQLKRRFDEAFDGVKRFNDPALFNGLKLGASEARAEIENIAKGERLQGLKAVIESIGGALKELFGISGAQASTNPLRETPQLLGDASKEAENFKQQFDLTVNRARELIVILAQTDELIKGITQQGPGPFSAFDAEKALQSLQRVQEEFNSLKASLDGLRLPTGLLTLFGGRSQAQITALFDIIRDGLAQVQDNLDRVNLLGGFKGDIQEVQNLFRQIVPPDSLFSDTRRTLGDIGNRLKELSAEALKSGDAFGQLFSKSDAAAILDPLREVSGLIDRLQNARRPAELLSALDIIKERLLEAKRATEELGTKGLPDKFKSDIDTAITGVTDLMNRLREAGGLTNELSLGPAVGGDRDVQAKFAELSASTQKVASDLTNVRQRLNELGVPSNLTQAFDSIETKGKSLLERLDALRQQGAQPIELPIKVPDAQPIDAVIEKIKQLREAIAELSELRVRFSGDIGIDSFTKGGVEAGEAFAAALAQANSTVVAAAQALAQAATQAISQGFAGVANEVNTALQVIPPVMQSVATQVVSTVTAMLQQIRQAVVQTVEALNAVTLAAQQASASSSSFDESGFSGFAGGGRLAGAGTGTSDSLLIRASRGEWVIRERSASYYGDLLMRAINFAAIPREALIGALRGFRDGGRVDLHAFLTPPRFAGGGPVPTPISSSTGRHLGTIDFRMSDGATTRTFRVMTDRETAEGLTRFATAESYSKAGPAPSWDR